MSPWSHPVLSTLSTNLSTDISTELASKPLAKAQNPNSLIFPHQDISNEDKPLCVSASLRFRLKISAYLPPIPKHWPKHWVTAIALTIPLSLATPSNTYAQALPNPTTPLFAQSYDSIIDRAGVSAVQVARQDDGLILVQLLYAGAIVWIITLLQSSKKK
ncbi:MAG: hypothetical protein MUF49_22080 [Oculatellaceae cyanobacterium Prado106]|jgi:hypothetical protein|nr:hypothetical protein [Oculatellaceae cyanobacterium Prado106]